MSTFEMQKRIIQKYLLTDRFAKLRKVLNDVGFSTWKSQHDLERSLDSLTDNDREQLF